MSTRRSVWFARHAPVDVHGVCYGRTEVPVLQDEATAAEVLLQGLLEPQPPLRPTTLWASPRRRCTGPATLVAERLGLALRIDERLTEVDMGLWDGLRFEEIEQRWPDDFAHWMANWQTSAPPDGESLAAFEGRVGAWWDEHVTPNPQATHAVVGHAGVLRALTVRTEGIPWHQAMALKVPFLHWMPVGRTSAE